MVTLLSDLFGIQARGGCSCAGPYGHALLGVGPDARAGFAGEVAQGRMGIKPGWARVSLPYFLSEAAFDYILRAVHFIANHGWRLLPHYRFDAKTGAWSHGQRNRAPMVALGAIDYATGSMRYPDRARPAAGAPAALADHLDQAMKLVGITSGQLGGDDDDDAAPLPETFERLRWFPLPGEIDASAPALGPICDPTCAVNPNLPNLPNLPNPAAPRCVTRSCAA